MNRRNRRLLGFVIAGILVLAGVRIVDPAVMMDRSPSVDLSDPPGEIAHDAISDLQSADYTYTMIANGTVIYERRVENTDRQAFTRMLVESPSDRRQWFSTDGMAWFRRGSRAWSKNPPGLFRTNSENPFAAPSVRSDATIINESNRTLEIRIEERETVRRIAEVDACYGPVILEIDTESRRLKTVQRLYECSNERYWIEYQFSAYGETEVTRPDGVPPFSVEEFFWDVFRTPLWP